MVDVFEQLAADTACRFTEEIPVDGDDLRDVGHRIFGEARGLGGNQDITWGIAETHVRGQDDREDRPQATPIEGIILNDEHGPAEAWFRARRFSEIGPAHLTTFDYHASRSSDRRCSRRTSGAK